MQVAPRLLDDVTPADGARWSMDLGTTAPAFTGCSVEVRRLRGGQRAGVQVVRIVTPRLTLEVLPTRGMGIWKAEVDGLPLGWSSPVRGPVHPMWVNLYEPDGRGWLRGFDEFVVRCGLTSNGAPDVDADGRLRHPLHGHIANLPARDVVLETAPERGEIVLRAEVDETQLFAPRLRLATSLVVRLDEPGFTVHDEIVNDSATAAEVQLLYHVNLGPPLLGAGSTLLAPFAEVTPRDDAAAATVDSWDTCDGPGSREDEEVYFCRLHADPEGRTGVLFRDGAGAAGLMLRFDVSQLPCFSFWKNLVAEEDGYVIGLEPATNFPNPRAFESSHGRTLTLPPGGSRRFDMTYTVYTREDQLAVAEQWIAAVSAGRGVAVHDAPQAGTCHTRDPAT